MKVKKIAVIGISASGKSTFSRELQKLTGLPLFHMDKLLWRRKWIEVPEKEYLAEQQNLLRKDEWIIEGYVNEKMSDRLRQAYLIIYLDYSGLHCGFNYLKRVFKHRHVARPEMHEEALDHFDPDYFWTILAKKERPGIEAALKDVDQSKAVRVTSPRALRKFVNTKLK